MATKAVKRPRLLFKAISFAMAGAICAAPFSITFSVFLLNNRLNRIVDREMTDIPALFHYEQVFNDQNSEVIGSGVLGDYLQHKSLSGHRDGAFVYIGLRDFHKTTMVEGRVTYPNSLNLTKEYILTCAQSRIPFIFFGDQVYYCTTKIVSFDKKFVSIIGVFKPDGSIIDDTKINIILIVAMTFVASVLAVFVQYKITIHVTRKLSNINGRTLLLLGNTIALRDNDTYHHNLRVMIYSYHFGRSLGLGEESLRDLINGALLHDIGKIGIQDAILHKPGKLDRDEFEAIKTHVNLGEAIIKDADWLGDSVAVVKYHHERYDGRGYPNGLIGDAIPVNARIFAIVDVFDALTCDRPYKTAMSYEKAMAYLLGAKGGHFDPNLVDKFLQLAHWLFDNFANRNDQVIDDEAARILNTYYY